MWISNGLAGYMAMMYEKEVFGTNHFKYHLYKDIQQVCYDPHNDALYRNDYTSPLELYESELLRKKSVLVIYLIAKRIGQEGFQRVYS